MAEGTISKIENQEREIQKSSAYTEYLLNSLKNDNPSNEHTIFKNGFDAGWNKATSLVKAEICEVLVGRLRNYIVDNIETITGDEIDYDIKQLLEGIID